MKNEQLFTSESEHWCTPPKIIERIEIYFGQIGLDPCSNDFSRTNAKISFDITKGTDGLSLPWDGYGITYINPPYGRKISKWSKKMAKEALNKVEMISLVPARVDTKWFQIDLVPAASSCLFVKGRLKFIDGTTGEQVKNSATFPSAIVYSGDRRNLFKKAFDGMGFFCDFR